ncbi:MAG: guanylate kinase [Oscillospiraceae bacterium]|nr:guanylate kinase [Oscillospiraceae bacterium]
MQNKGILYVLSAPSGCGKGTILSEVLKNFKNIHYSVSATTRSPRDGELNGINYYFITREEFESEISNGGMFEYAEFCGNYYGTPKAKVMEKLDAGIDVILEIETIGAMKVKQAYPDAVLIFILPPNVEALKQRLIGRGTEALDVIERRVGEAASEIEKSYNYDYVLVNDNLIDAIEGLETIMKSCKYMTKFNSNTIKGVLN